MIDRLSVAQLIIFVINSEGEKCSFFVLLSGLKISSSGGRGGLLGSIRSGVRLKKIADTVQEEISIVS